MAIEEIRSERLKKLKLLRDKGINPYPSSSSRSHTISQIIENFDSVSACTIAGRVIAIREHGGAIFIDITDGTGVFQGFLKKDEIDDPMMHELFIDAVDIGDFIDISGEPYKTKKGELSILVKSWAMLSKSLLPLPEKWEGLKDPEERLRKRYLDILFNDDIRELFVKKAIFWNSTREFMIKEGFLEVETPVLETTTGGADAEPFKTHHNALDMDVYLRISCGELWQKELMVAGYPKVFEMGRIFRNEGMSHEHSQDYTQMEFYLAYANYEEGMEITERLFKYVIEKTFGTLKFDKLREHDVDLSGKWERIDYGETIKNKTGIDVFNTELSEIENKLVDLGVKFSKDGFNMVRGIDSLWKYCRKEISGPVFLTGLPKLLSPLAKSDPQNEKKVEQFQLLIAGTELVKGYSELNDPIDQKERFEAQEKMRRGGDAEAHMSNPEFVEALEHGMPPTCGFGMSERVFSIFFPENQPAKRKFFPLMRPRE